MKQIKIMIFQKSNSLKILFKTTHEFRTNLFEYFLEFFEIDDVITDELLFYFKMLVSDLVKNNKRYKHNYADIIFDLTNKVTNLRLVRSKYVFKCFIVDEEMCYFKENGTEYYLS